MASESKKRKCKNTHYDRGGEKGKIHYLKGYAMYNNCLHFMMRDLNFVKY